MVVSRAYDVSTSGEKLTHILIDTGTLSYFSLLTNYTALIGVYFISQKVMYDTSTSLRWYSKLIM